MLRSLSVPFHGAPLVFVVVVSVLLWIGLAAGWPGLPLLILAASWTWTYAYLLIERTAHGLPPPVLSVEMANPWHEPRPLLQLVLCAAVASLVVALADRGAVALAALIAASGFVLLPASLAVLAIESHLGRAVWPPALYQVARGLGLYYVAVWLIAIMAGAIVLAVAPRVPRLASLAIGEFAVLTVAAALGGALYARRDELGLEVWESPEKHAAIADAALLKSRDAAMEEAYGLLRVRDIEGAWQRVRAAIGPAPVDPSSYRWCRDRASQWNDRRIADGLTTEMVARLIVLGRRGEALTEVESWWQNGGTYRAGTARDLDVLKSVATSLGRTSSVTRLQQERGQAQSAS